MGTLDTHLRDGSDVRPVRLVAVAHPLAHAVLLPHRSPNALRPVRPPVAWGLAASGHTWAMLS